MREARVLPRIEQARATFHDHAVVLQLLQSRWFSLSRAEDDCAVTEQQIDQWLGSIPIDKSENGDFSDNAYFARLQKKEGIFRALMECSIRCPVR